MWQYGNGGVYQAVQAKGTACTKVFKLQNNLEKENILKEDQSDFSVYWVSLKEAQKNVFLA